MLNVIKIFIVAMGYKIKLFLSSFFFLCIGLCFSLQAIFWEIYSIAWMTVVVSFIIIPLLDYFLGEGNSPNLSNGPNIESLKSVDGLK